MVVREIPVLSKQRTLSASRSAVLEDLPAIIQLLEASGLPHSDIVPGKQQFVVAEIDQKMVAAPATKLTAGTVYSDRRP